ncbi:GNAT family N-acetyltransferase [Catenuloplanes indicus]|uniref:GNAT superfamily N-acetyltransferase n=1 Tax=Catenuloplanes indicus TaxID=137267 RepID=A0AAE3W3M7_9ACTN|nr:GNAT family N-acetyltransferase [Catenuloplanes indicus]MDQ0369373.1 GNAT superfamily N-acetyltransferase [Catenuloplanes indicus]
MSATILRHADLSTDSDAVTALMSDYLSWAVGRLREEYGVEDSPTDLSAIRESLPSFVPPKGLLIVAERDGEPVGVAALRTLTPEMAEVKRMYVDPRGRGLGLGAALLDRLLTEAHGTLGATTIRLDTCRFMTDAQRLYLSRGFVERGPYEETEIPAHMRQHWRFFERDLHSAPTDARPAIPLSPME